MNADRRKAISKAQDTLDRAFELVVLAVTSLDKSEDTLDSFAQDSARNLVENAEAILEDAISGFEDARDEEQDYMDNMPEGLQESEKYARAEEVVNALTSTCDTIEGFTSDLSQWKGDLATLQSILEGKDDLFEMIDNAKE